MYVPTLDLRHSPTLGAFLADQSSFVRGLRGPFGSGKSTACCAAIGEIQWTQKPGADGVRRSRIACIRNTTPELKTTTIRTYLEWFRPEHCGPIRWSSPISQHIQLPATAAGPGLDSEVWFIALDRPGDVRKLLSMELTAAWVNEAREVPWPIIDALRGRINRYPRREQGGATRACMILDTNPPDQDSWWYRVFESERHTGKYTWRQYVQPPAVFELRRRSDNLFEAEAAAPSGTIYVYDEREVHRAANKYWGVNPETENLPFVAPGYYEQQLAGKGLDAIQAYLQNQYVYVKEGRPVVPEYQDHLMAVRNLDVMNDRPLVIGLDFGLTPAAAIMQRHPLGAWMVHSEVVSFDMGLERFCDILLQHLGERFPRHQVGDCQVWGDPAGEQRDQIYEATAFSFLRTRGLNARPAPTNDSRTRRDALAAPMNRFIDGRPGFLVNSDCHYLRKGLSGAYRFRRLAVAGHSEKFSEKPDKNEFSHICEAAGYAVLAAGEYRAMVAPERRWANTGPAQAHTADFHFDPTHV